MRKHGQIYMSCIAQDIYTLKVYEKNKESQKTLLIFKGEQWGSNPRPSEPQSDALTN